MSRTAAPAGYLRAGAIARELGLSERTVRRWIGAGLLPSCRIGGARLVARAALARLLGAASDPPEEAADAAIE